MATLAHPSSNFLQALSRSFSDWLSRSAVAGGKIGPVFRVDQSSASLDSARASRLIRNGVRAGSIDELVALFGLGKKEDLSHALNANSTSLWRWARDDKPLPGPTVEQILRAMHLQLFASEVFGGVDPARQWLHKPHPSLGGVPPSDYANNEYGAQKVHGMLAGLKYGGVA